MMYNRQTQWNFGLLHLSLWLKPLISIQKEPFLRGACVMITNVHARKSIRIHDQSNTLPCNVKFMIEGKKKWKCQSKTFVENNTEKLKNDVI
jgi:hypothetical protein